MLAAQTFALAISTMHLGKPHRFYRTFNNLRYSPISREVAAIGVFYGALSAYTLLTVAPGLFGWLLPATFVPALRAMSGWVAVLAGPVSL